MKTYIHLWFYFAEFFLEREMFQKRVVVKIKTRFILDSSPPPPRKLRHLWCNVDYDARRTKDAIYLPDK
jgi:hypothetical protein